MSDAERDQLRGIWRQLSRRNRWSLVTNEDAFLDQSAIELAALNEAAAEAVAADPEGSASIRDRPRTAIQRAYSILLYRGLQARDQQAVEELWFAVLRVSLTKGWDRADAEELAQETIARVLEKFAQARSPQTFLAWSMMIFRTVQRDYAKRRAAESPLSGDEDGEMYEVADPADMAVEIEQNLLSTTIIAALRAALPNALERLVLLRVVLFGDHPRDVARDLGLPLPRTRLAKSRALQRLRDDAAFQSLVDRLSGGLSASGGQDDVA